MKRWPRPGRWLSAVLLAELSLHARAATAWIRKEAEIAAHGLSQLRDGGADGQVFGKRTADSRSRDMLSQPDDAVWKVLHAGTPESLESFEDAIPAPLLNMRSPSAPMRIRSQAFHPTKGGNLNHSGYSPYVGAPDLSFPSWTFVHPEVQPKGLRTATKRVFHGSPLIDADLNVYIQSTSGWIFSFTKERQGDGELRWSFDLNSEDPQNPGNMALLDGTAFVCTEDGMAWAIDLVEGAERRGSSGI
eukprot:s6367_g1.t1